MEGFQIAVIILSSVLILLATFTGFLFVNKRQTKFELDDLRKKYNKLKEVCDIPIHKGTRCAIHNYKMTYKKDKNFNVVLEVKILDLTSKKAKIEVIDVDSDDDVYHQENLKKGVINFLNNRWVNISLLDIIMDDNYHRLEKIKKLNL